MTPVHFSLVHAFLPLARRRFFCLVVLAFSFLTCHGVSRAQDGIFTPPKTPLDTLTPKDFDRVDFFTGQMELNIPFLNVSGRGDLSVPVAFRSKGIWEIRLDPDVPGTWYVMSPSWRDNGIKNIASDLDPFVFGSYVGGMMQARTESLDIGRHTCSIERGFRNGLTVTTLTYTAPDGTVYELRDQANDGKPLAWTAFPCGLPGHSRADIFVSNDGSGATFISDRPIQDIGQDTGLVPDWESGRQRRYAWPSLDGYLMLRDGTRFRIENWRTVWMRDRNGNQITFHYDYDSFTSVGTTQSIPYSRVSKITDSFDREVIFTYNIAGGAPYGLHDQITYKGFGGQARVVRISRKQLDSALRQGQTIKTNEELIPPFYPIVVPADFNPTVTSAIWLPNGTSYKLLYNSYAEIARIELPTGGAIEYDYAFSTGPTGRTIKSGGVPWIPFVYRRVTERREYAGGGSALTGKMTVSQTVIVDDNKARYVDVSHYNSGNIELSRQRHYFYGIPELSMASQSMYYGSWRFGKEYRTEEVNPADGTVLRRVDFKWEQRESVSWWYSTPFVYVAHEPLFGHTIIGAVGAGNLLPELNPETTRANPLWNGNPEDEPPNDPRITEIVTTIEPDGAKLVSKQAFSYDQYNNQTDVYEYAFGAGAPGPLVRRTHTDYVTFNNGVNYAAENNIHIRNLPLQKQVSDAGGTKRAETFYEYDLYDNSPNHAPLIDRPGISGLDSGFTTGYTTRGNVTRTSSALLDNNGDVTGWVNSHAQYDIAGNAVKAINANGNDTIFDFSDRFDSSPDDEAQSNDGAPELAGGSSYAFPTKVTNALGHTTYTQYDYYLGKPVNSEDANGGVSSVAYNDALDRPTQGIQARYKAGSGALAERNQTTINYDDTNRVITTTSDRDAFNDNILTGKSYYDGLGRTSRRATYEGSTWTILDTRFDALGRVSQVSNPYRAADPDSASPPANLWTTTDYDALGRMIRVTTPDDAHLDTTYSGNQVTVTDQAIKRRRSETDALGRLIKITEDPGNLNYETHYSYDALGNLRQVTQGSQARTFVYDSLSRLTSATNPESGTITYAYDPNGNLIEKTDARGVRTTMTYDALNRVRSKVYTGTTPEGTAAANVTPPVNYFYDDYSGLPSGAPSWPGTPSKGRLTGVTYGPGSEGTYYKYDADGRIATNHQRQGASNYATTYAYNLASGVTHERRGNYLRISSAYDNAGRLRGVDTSFTPFLSFVPRVKDISYTPFGAIQSEKYGNGLIHSMSYNERHQPAEISLGRPDNLESVFRIGYIFGTAHNVNGQDPEIISVHNNGNIARIKYFISGTLQYSQTFQYDPLNRIGYAVEHNNGTYNDGARAWYQTFDYNRHGTRGINVDNTSDNADAANTALKLADFSAANNKITRAEFVYDTAGNLIAEPGKSYTYDGENRMVTATVAGGGTSQYVYDGNGRRVKKITGGVTTRFEYGAGDELIAERNEATGFVTKGYFYRSGELLATTVNGADYEYATADHLGSPRAWTGGDGNLIAGGRHDYLAFGEELFAGYGVRTTDQAYATSTQQDGQRKQFTSKERDSETGLDYFLARYYSSLQGRFTSPDEFTGGPVELFYFAEDASDNPTFYADLTNPQSLNKYQYTYNSPLRYTDPTGHCPRCIKAAVKTGIKSAIKGKVDLGEVYDAYDAVKTLVDSDASTLDKGLAVLDLLLPVSSKELKAVDKFLDNTDFVKDAQKAIGKLHTSTLEPGPHAGDFIPARGPQRDFTSDERAKINEIGGNTGCHTCGSKDPKTKSGNFIPDHQPANALNPNGQPQRLHPHCNPCSKRQGGEIRAKQQKEQKKKRKKSQQPDEQ